ncbi:hypothetical protein GQ457_09G026750 [Hibiscus cannabinus]
MASSFKASTALFLSLNLVFFALVSSHSVDSKSEGSSCTANYRNPVVIRPGDVTPNGSGQSGTCNPLNLGVCLNLLSLVDVELGNVPTKPCCSLIEGLADVEAAVCLCTAIKATKFADILDESSWWDDPLSSISTLNSSGERWSLTLVRTITLTSDGVACHYRAGCGGVLREASGNIRLLLYCPIHGHGSEYAEVMVVFFGLDLFREANWIGKIFLIVESDSSLVLNWINEKSQRPLRCWKVFYEINRLVAQINHVKFQHIARKQNHLPNFLAKTGRNSSSEFKE